MGLCQKGLTSWRRSTEKLWELSFFLFFLSMSKILPRETNCDGPFYHRTAWTHEEDWCLIVICLCFSAFEWFQFSFTAWHACLPSTEHPPPPPTEAWCCALTLIYRTGLGRAQWSYLCLTKTLTWYIATYSFCGLSTAIQSEWAGGQRQVRRPLQQENWIMEATLHHHLATLQKWLTGKGLCGLLLAKRSLISLILCSPLLSFCPNSLISSSASQSKPDRLCSVLWHPLVEMTGKAYVTKLKKLTS